VLLTIGLGAILVRLCTPWGRRPDVLLALLVTLACAYAWYAASTLALLAGTTLLAFRLESLVVLTLGTAGVIALAELAPGASRLVAEQRWAPTRAAGTAVALTVLAVTQVATDRGDSLDERVEYAYSTPYPDGPDAMGRVDPASEEGWSDALAAEIARLSRTDPEDLVVLSTDYALLSHHPYRGFQQISPHYANPLADYDDRAAYIRRMAGATSAADLTGLLDDCPWWPPTVFVLRQEADGLHLRLGRDAFPASPNVEFTDVVFAPAVFRSAGFSTADVGPYLVAVRRS
jgi:galactan 5-O-arabinofuranosyltransferase